MTLYLCLDGPENGNYLPYVAAICLGYTDYEWPTGEAVMIHSSSLDWA